MANVTSETEPATRTLTIGDLDRIVAIDLAHSGSSRRGFFEKRFAAAKLHPDDYVQVGVVDGGRLCGFATAQILRGEFGRERAVAVLDGLGVEADSRNRGHGRALMRELSRCLRKMDIRSLQSEAVWSNHDLLRFFAGAEFKLAPRLVLQRPVGAPLDEISEEI